MMDLVFGFIVLCLLQMSMGAEKSQCSFDDIASVAQTMTCIDIVSEVDLDVELKNARRFNVPNLVIQGSNLRFFKQDSFEGTKFRTIAIRDSSILELTDRHNAFTGLEDILETLEVEDTSFVSHWDWNHLRDLTNLKKLIVKSSDLVYVSDTLENVSSRALEHIQFSKNGIAWVHDKAFAKLEQLKRLELDGNEIDGLKRQMFPSPALQLEYLDFSDNLLRTLPMDLFADMPSLKVIKFSRNALRTLDERVFSKIYNQLSEFIFESIPLSCDCRLMWMTRVTQHPKTTKCICETPSQLKGTSVVDMKTRDLWC